jgi:hypothetical protein
VAIGGEIAGDGNVAAVRTAFALLCKYWESNDQVPRVGTQLESWLRQTGEFGEVNVHKVIAPVGNTSSEPAAAAASMAQNLVQQEGSVSSKCKPLGLTFTNSFRRSFSAETHPGLLALGFTPELKGQCTEEMNASEWRMDLPLYLVWAQKFA